MQEPTPLDQYDLPGTQEHEDAPAHRSLRGDMPLLDHLDELRGTLIRCAVALMLGIVLVAAFIKQAAGALNWPLEFALGPDDPLVIEGLKTDGPWGVFSVIFDITLMGGMALALPFILYFFARFISPGLNERELRILRPVMFAAFALFLTGAGFSFFLLCPAALKASIMFNKMFSFQILWSADQYYGTLLWMMLGVGVLFEFPLIIVGLVTTGVLKVQQLRHYRSYALVGFLALSAVITPTTDPVTFLILAIPMFALYEAAILVSAPLQRWRERAKL